MKRHGVRPFYYATVKSILRFCETDESREEAIAAMFRHRREWFF